MAWELFHHGSVQGVSGDMPFDEMRSALKHIRRCYRERFGRNPYFAELLHALQATVEANPSAYVADSPLPSLERLVESVGGETPFEHIDPGDYVGALEATSDGFLVFPRVPPTETPTRDSAVLRGQVMESEKGHLCRYVILSPSITDNMARSLIRQCVLQDLLGYNIVNSEIANRFEKIDE
jgi:hypothetical protein